MSYKGHKISYRKNDKRWTARVRKNKKIYYVYDKNQKKCYEKLKKLIEDLSKNKKEVSNKILLNTWLDKWQELYKTNKNSESTIKTRKSVINKHIKDTLGKIEITKITAVDILELLNSIDKGKTRVKVYEVLKDSLTKAFKHKLIKEDLFLLIEKPKYDKKESRAFTKQEEQNFITECMQNELKDYFLITLFQGLRKSETLNLRREDIDFENKLLKICEHNEFEEHKGLGIKTKASIRTIPIFNKTYEILKNYKNKNGKLFKFTDKKVYDNFYKIKEKLNLKDCTIHTLRHTFITRCVEFNIPLKVIQQWAGHSSSKITNDVYSHVTTDFELECKQNFDTHFDTLFSKKNE